MEWVNVRIGVVLLGVEVWRFEIERVVGLWRELEGREREKKKKLKKRMSERKESKRRELTRRRRAYFR